MHVNSIFTLGEKNANKTFFCWREQTNFKKNMYQDGAVLHRGGGHAVLYQDDVVHGVEGTIIWSSVVAISHVVA